MSETGLNLIPFMQIVIQEIKNYPVSNWEYVGWDNMGVFCPKLGGTQKLWCCYAMQKITGPTFLKSRPNMN
jgi:hypothetical protein